MLDGGSRHAIEILYGTPLRDCLCDLLMRAVAPSRSTSQGRSTPVKNGAAQKKIGLELGALPQELTHIKQRK